MTVGSLFAGIGGFDLGFERAGFDIRWQVEIDPWARAVLAKHWPHVHRRADVRTVGRRNLEPVDVICGGFPCQDISYAGSGAGLAGSRSGLWVHFARIVRELRPSYVVVENVPALRSRGLGVVLGDLAACRYDAEWDCIPAAAVGAPHRRDRLWLVAYPDGGGLAGLRRRWIDRAADPRAVPELCGAADVADADGGRCQERGLQESGGIAGACGRESDGRRLLREQLHAAPDIFGDDARRRLERAYIAGVSGRWASDAGVRRVAHGIPRRMDRLRGLGNAIVPAIAEWIAESIAIREAAIRELEAAS